jgi:acid phosphatase type 7
MYCSNSDECTSKGGDRLRKEAEALFYTYKVNLVITGHVHSYERTYPVYNDILIQDNYISPNGSVYILQGGSGNREGNDGFGEGASWSAAHDGTVGFGIMTVTSGGVSFSYYEARDDSLGGPILKDSFELTQWAD